MGPGTTPWGGISTQCLRVRTGQKVASPLGFGIVFYDDFDVDFGRLGVDLGSVLGVILDRFGTLVGQSWSQDRLRTILTSKK